MVAQTQSQEEAVRCFEMCCRAKGLAESTVKMYSFALDRLGRCLSDEAKGPSVPSREDLRGCSHMAQMLAAGLSRQTIRVRMRAIRVFSNFLARENRVAESPMAGVEIPRAPTVMPEVLSAPEVERLFRAAKRRSWCGTGNYAMLAVFLDTGLRLGELIALDVKDIDVGSAVIRVRNGRGSEERHVHAVRALARTFVIGSRSAHTRWETWRCSPHTLGGDSTSDTSRGSSSVPQGMHGLMVGVSTRTHLLRHAFATQYIMNGGDPFSLQEILGRSDITTTMIYVNLAGVGLRGAHAKASSVDRSLARD